MSKATATPITVRLWVSANGGWVWISLRDGDCLSHSTGGPTDEGWQRRSTEWSRDGDTICESWDSAEKDCDGLYTSDGGRSCGVDDLEGQSFKDDNDEVVTIPRWGDVDQLNRDHTAEAAGY